MNLFTQTERSKRVDCENMASKILIVEDDQDIIELLTYNLGQAGFDIHVVCDGTDALQHATSAIPDLIILDLLLPEIDGLEVCRLLKANPQTATIPIVMLTAKAEQVDRIVGFELGADDYIVKPFSPREVVLRVRAVLRRADSDSVQPPSTIRIRGLSIDLDKRVVCAAKNEINLTPIEFEILTRFVRNPGRVFTRDVLMDLIWGQEYFGVDRTVDTHISRLRRKLGPFGRCIETVHGVGYRFSE